jgi:hypothetical protein
MTPEQESGLRAVARTTEVERWLAVARETDTPEQSYRAAALGMSVDDWEPCARAGADFDAVFAAIRSIYFDDAGARLAALGIAQFAPSLSTTTQEPTP